MPCPYFEPLRAVSDPTRPQARLPLLNEFTGMCHAAEQPVPPPRELLAKGCNQGYSRGVCAYFPEGETCSSLRYSVTGQTASVIELVCIEEADFAPLRWSVLQYRLSDGSVLPEETSLLIRAQAAAFAREWVRRSSS